VRPKRKSLTRPNGFGDCYDCVRDESNRLCKGYCPVGVRYYEVRKDGEGNDEKALLY